jgi:hypothetical protein
MTPRTAILIPATSRLIDRVNPISQAILHPNRHGAAIVTVEWTRCLFKVHLRVILNQIDNRLLPCSLLLPAIHPMYTVHPISKRTHRHWHNVPDTEYPFSAVHGLYHHRVHGASNQGSGLTPHTTLNTSFEQSLNPGPHLLNYTAYSSETATTAPGLGYTPLNPTQGHGVPCQFPAYGHNQCSAADYPDSLSC